MGSPDKIQLDHTRRTTDKRDAFEATLSDILTAFSKLDDDDKLPPIYCEALHLINLPCLELSNNTNNGAIKFLAQKVDTSLLLPTAHRKLWNNLFLP